MAKGRQERQTAAKQRKQVVNMLQKNQPSRTKKAPSRTKNTPSRNKNRKAKSTRQSHKPKRQSMRPTNQLNHDQGSLVESLLPQPEKRKGQRLVRFPNPLAFSQSQAGTLSSHITHQCMGEHALGPFWSIPGTYPGFQGPKNGNFYG